MPSKEQLVRDVVRLRRAHHRHPDDEDIGAVRAALERAAGPTVGRAAAARLLGVSQTALDRWVAAGAVPVVLTPGGRRELPLHALVELIEAVDACRNLRHPLAAVLRARAPACDPSPREASDHRRAELRGLAYHRAVAERLGEDIVADALVRLRRWRAEGRIHPRYADAWEELLAGPRERLARTIAADDEQGAALRQSSPLAGVLDERERRRVLGIEEAQ